MRSLQVRKLRSVPFSVYELLGLLLLFLAALAYVYTLTAWRLDDDEGTYLYGAWRISLVEVIYRDFLTCVLPPFQYMAALLIRLFGPALLPIRAFSVGLTLLSTASYTPWPADTTTGVWL